MRKTGTVLILILLILFPFTILQAQDDNRGNISGQVLDRDTRESLIGVNVIIRGTTFGAATDIDGNYTIRGIRPGEYTLEVSYIGYERQLITEVVVRAGETTELNIELGEVPLSVGDEVVVIGTAPIFDIERSSSSTNVGRDQIAAAPVRRVDEIVGQQAGVIRDPSGVFIRGGRSYETGFVIDGVSAQDPLAGTGFGIDLGANAFSNVEVITGGVDAEFGDVTSGVISVRTQEGGENYRGTFTHKRDNFFGPSSRSSNFNTDVYELTFGGPTQIVDNLKFFFSGQVFLTDEFYGTTADQIRTSLYDTEFWSPRQDSRWSGMFKLTYRIKPTMRLEAAYNRSITVNQNTRMLQITGADVSVRPGYQFFFEQNLDNANVYTHDSNLSYVKWTHTYSNKAFYDIQVSRLFTRLRTDVNGMNWRPEQIDGEFDPESIVTPPVNLFPGTDGFQYVLPGPGFANNGGLATLWHDHFAEEITIRGTHTRHFLDRSHRLVTGLEMKFQDYQWIDITRPWIGAPIEIGDGEFTESFRLGDTSDIWRVKPQRGALWATHQIRYQGLIANIGARFEYWAPGKYVDNFVEDPLAPIPDNIRQDYLDSTTEILGLRYKFRLLPRLGVSFPVRENQVLFFNYQHMSRVPHPRFIYAGLDPFYQDRSFLANLGNPNLNPEVDISYEIGMRNQLTSNDALNVTAFWRDKYDFITSQRIRIQDATGRDTERSYRINGDYARVRGFEITYFKRYRDWAQGQFSVTYSRAEGLSSTSDDALRNIVVGGQAIGNNVETPLAWDRPWDIKGNVILTYDRPNPLFGLRPLNQMRLYLAATWRSGIRYTPMIFQGFEANPITGEADWRPIYEQSDDPADRFSETGSSWFMMDLNFQKWFKVSGNRVAVFLEITNLLNNSNAAIINPVTGKAYRSDYPTDQQSLVELRNDRSFDVPANVRDPRYQDPRDNNTPAYLNPANFLEQRHIMLGLSFEF